MRRTAQNTATMIEENDSGPAEQPSRGLWWRSVGMILIGGVLLGSVGAASAYAPAAASPVALGGLRVATGATALIAAARWVGGSWPGLLRLARNPRIWVLGVCTAAFQPLFFAAVDRTGVATTALVATGAVPLFAGMIGWTVLGHRPSVRWAVATAIAVAGLALRSWRELHGGDPWGVAMALAAAFSVGCYVVTATVELRQGTPALEVSAVAFSIAAVLLAPLVVGEPLAWAVTGSGVAVIAYLGVVTMGVGNLCNVRGMGHLQPGPAATLMLSDPLVATLLGVVVLHEGLGPAGAAGVVLVGVGLVLQSSATPAPADRTATGNERPAELATG